MKHIFAIRPSVSASRLHRRGHSVANQRARCTSHSTFSHLRGSCKRPSVPCQKATSSQVDAIRMLCQPPQTCYHSTTTHQVTSSATPTARPLSGHRRGNTPLTITFTRSSTPDVLLTLPAARLLRQPLDRNKPDACAPLPYRTLSTESALRVLLLPTAFTPLGLFSPYI